MKKLTIGSMSAALVALLWIGQAQAATFTVDLTGSASNPTESTVDFLGNHYDFFSFALLPVSNDLPITIHQGDVINSTISLDGPVTIPSAPLFTGYTQFFFGSSFPDEETGVDNGTLTFFSGTTLVRTLGFSTTTRGQIAAGAVSFPPDNTPFTFDNVTNTFTITDLAIPATLDRSTFEYVLASSSVAAVPEPAIWGMMLLGFGLVGWMLRGRRREQKQFFA